MKTLLALDLEIHWQNARAFTAPYPLQNIISSLPIHLFMEISIFKAMPSKKFYGIFKKCT